MFYFDFQAFLYQVIYTTYCNIFLTIQEIFLSQIWYIFSEKNLDMHFF